MIPLRQKITLGIIFSIFTIISYIIATANWYRDCFKQSTKVGYTMAFLPIIMGCIIAFLYGMELLGTGDHLVDEAVTVGALTVLIVLSIAIVLQFMGKCTPKCEKADCDRIEMRAKQKLFKQQMKMPQPQMPQQQMPQRQMLQQQMPQQQMPQQMRTY